MELEQDKKVTADEPVASIYPECTFNTENAVEKMSGTEGGYDVRKNREDKEVSRNAAQSIFRKRFRKLNRMTIIGHIHLRKGKGSISILQFIFLPDC